MKPKSLAGVFPPVTTPFDSEGNLLLDRFEENLDRWAEQPLGGVTVLGSNGESAYLSDAEKLALLDAARPRVADSKTLIAGAGRESTRLCLEFIGRIADRGADYALVGVPCYYKTRMTDEALYRHYSRIADGSPIPILLYNVPQFTGVAMGNALIERLSRHDRIAGIKDSSANIQLQGEIRKSARADFHLLVGSGQTLLHSLIQGACGAIVAVACPLPALTVSLLEAFRAGDWQRAARLQEQLAPPAVAVTSTFGVPGLKTALDLMGFFGGEPRLPLLPLDPPQREALVEVFGRVGVLGSRNRNEAYEHK